MSHPPFENEAKVHRWFAIQCNNAAWDAIEAPARTESEDERLIHTAHASVHHWLQIGDPIHYLRGLTLLASTYGAIGRSHNALHYANRCEEQLVSCEDATPFDKAMVYGNSAQAAKLNGDADQAARALAKLQEIIATLEGEEAEIVRSLFVHLSK